MVRRKVLEALALVVCASGCHHPASTCEITDAGEPPPYLHETPDLGVVTVVDISNQPADTELLARSLQGIVNRATSRMYLLDNNSTADQQAGPHWLDVYQSDKEFTAGPAGTVNDALTQFASEVQGYLLVSLDDRWTIDAATIEAGTDSAVLATTVTAPMLDSMGIHQLDTFIGRWPDALSCYNDLAEQVGIVPRTGFAIMASGDLQLRDFLIQQDELTLGSYGFEPEWPAVMDALARMPKGVQLYGYPARTGEEELSTVTNISNAGDVLVASDSTPNVSFHSGIRLKTIAKPAIENSKIDCSGAELNVVIALSDGDNLIVPVSEYASSDYWLAPQRGQIPISWSLSGGLSTIAPGVFDYYARTLAPGDELVMMIGPGYAYGSAMPNPDWFFAQAFQEMQEQGLRVLWMFDPLNEGTGHYYWTTRAHEAMACGSINGVLDGYYPGIYANNAPGNETDDGVPLIRAEGAYSDGPTDIAGRIQTLLALPKAQRPPVVFYSAAIWSNTIPALVAAMTPLKQQGVRFLNASQGMQCVTK